jgi:hypothetical protein
MKNILIIFGLLVNSVYGQNNSEIVNLDSINFYFGEKLNTERLKVGKPVVSFDIKYSVVELDWIDKYFKYIKNQEDACNVSMKKGVPYVYSLPTMHGTDENTYFNRYEKHFNYFTPMVGENMAIVRSKDSLNYVDLNEKLFSQWVNSKRHYENMLNIGDKLTYGKYCLVVRYIKYNGYYIYMGGLFLVS